MEFPVFLYLVLVVSAIGTTIFWGTNAYRMNVGLSAGAQWLSVALFSSIVEEIWWAYVVIGLTFGSIVFYKNYRLNFYVEPKK